MSLPIRCFSCGKVLGDKWDTYIDKCKQLGDGPNADELDTANTRKDSPDGKTARGKILDDLGVKMLCCRTVMLTTVDMSTVI